MIDHYAVNKFVYDTDRNPEFVRRYIEDPAEYVDEYFYQHGTHPFLLWTLMLPVLEAKLASGEFVLDMSTVPEGVRAENRKPMAFYRAKIEKHGRPYYGY
jgi:hypothetical protein